MVSQLGTLVLAVLIVAAIFAIIVDRKLTGMRIVGQGSPEPFDVAGPGSVPPTGSALTSAATTTVPVTSSSITQVQPAIPTTPPSSSVAQAAPAILPAVPTPAIQTVPPVIPPPSPAPAITPPMAVMTPMTPISQLTSPTGTAPLPLSMTPISDQTQPAMKQPVRAIKTPVVPFVDNKHCKQEDRGVYTNDTAYTCDMTTRATYDMNTPGNLRKELEALDNRRRDIANRLNINLDPNHRVGCTTDADCNVLSWSLDGKKNVCKVDHTCMCNSGAGPLCLQPARYKDPAQMSVEEIRRFKMQDDLSLFTIIDYRRWLFLYRDDPQDLTDDHIKNFRLMMAGEEIHKNMIPAARLSPPPSVQNYLNLLDRGKAMQIKDLNLDTGPYLASNAFAYDNFIPPMEQPNLRGIDADSDKKVDAKALAEQVIPQGTRQPSQASG